MTRGASLVLAVGLALAACQSQGGPPAKAPPPPAPAPPAPKPVVTDITAQDYAMPPLPVARVTLLDAFGGRHAVKVEVAATRDARTRGLMWRTALAEGEGMLFLFPHDDLLTFWMKNTLIPLDMIFIDSAWRIVGIVAQAEPRSLESRGPGLPARYVLEVPGGWSAKVGLKPGLAVQADGLTGLLPGP